MRFPWKKQFCCGLCMILCCSLLNGCAQRSQSHKTTKTELVTTLFCYYDFARAILKDTDTISLSLLLSPGMESHSFEPSPSDILSIQNADIFLYNGGHMEHWVSEVLEADTSPNPDRIVRCMTAYAPLLAEAAPEGSESNHGHDHEHHEEEETCTDPEHHHHEAEETEIEYDEHIWTSPVVAKDLLYVVCDAICEADPANTELYQANTEDYAAELTALDADFRALFDRTENNTLLFADKFPLQYFATTYDLHCYAAFAGCSSDTEPSVATISHLMDLVNAEQLPAVYYFEVSSPAVAEVIAEETGAEPMIFQSCHTLTQEDFDNGETYISLMRRNLQALQTGLAKE